jgi:hypothetical protein
MKRALRIVGYGPMNKGEARMKRCPCCGLPVPLGGDDLLFVLVSDPDAYVYERADGRGWSVTRRQAIYSEETVRLLKADGKLVARWPGSEAGDAALTIPRHAMSRDEVMRRLRRKSKAQSQRTGA